MQHLQYGMAPRGTDVFVDIRNRLPNIDIDIIFDVGAYRPVRRNVYELFSASQDLEFRTRIPSFREALQSIFEEYLSSVRKACNRSQGRRGGNRADK